MIGEVKTSPKTWDLRFQAMAELVAEFSKDPKRRVGAVAVSPDRRGLSIGYNGFPAGTPDLQQDLEDPGRKEQLMVHAELNAILNQGCSVVGWTLHVTKHPCVQCAGAIANSGIARLVTPRADLTHPTWGRSYALAIEVLRDADVEVRYLEERPR